MQVDVSFLGVSVGKAFDDAIDREIGGVVYQQAWQAPNTAVVTPIAAMEGDGIGLAVLEGRGDVGEDGDRGGAENAFGSPFADTDAIDIEGEFVIDAAKYNPCVPVIPGSRDIDFAPVPCVSVDAGETLFFPGRASAQDSPVGVVEIGLMPTLRDACAIRIDRKLPGILKVN